MSSGVRIGGLPDPMWWTPSCGAETPDATFFYAAFASIVVCSTMYCCSGWISGLFTSKYAKLRLKERIDWDTRVVSIFHAILASAYAVYFAVTTDLLSSDLVLFQHRWSPAAIGLTWGYFCYDAFVVIANWDLIGSWPMMTHHIVGITCYLASVVWCAQGLPIIFGLTELTTPFLNIHVFLTLTGNTNGMALPANAGLLWLVWLLTRITMSPYTLYQLFRYDFLTTTPKALGWFIMINSTLMLLLNYAWFYQMTSSIIGVLRGTVDATGKPVAAKSKNDKKKTM